MDRAILLDALEQSVYWVPDVPGRVERAAIPGLTGYTMASPHALGTLVGLAAFDGPQADETIHRAKEFSAASGKGVTWVVGPSTTPHDLEERLRAAGFVQVWDMAGMALPDLGTAVASDPGVEIRVASPGDLPLVARTAARGFSMTEDLLLLYAEARLAGRGPSRTNVYLAFVDGDDEPVAYANLDYMPGEPVCRLGGASTVPEHRGHGVYSSLVARRLADARTMGMTAAVIQAQRSTSAPICRNLGFVEICPMTAFSWEMARGARG
jgi:GNAT superfamily N-acetyltransferase